MSYIILTTSNIRNDGGLSLNNWSLWSFHIEHCIVYYNVLRRTKVNTKHCNKERIAFDLKERKTYAKYLC